MVPGSWWYENHILPHPTTPSTPQPSPTVQLSLSHTGRCRGEATGQPLTIHCHRTLLKEGTFFRGLDNNTTHSLTEGMGDHAAGALWFSRHKGQTLIALEKFLMFIHIILTGALRTPFGGSKYFPSNFLSLVLLAAPYKPPDHASRPAEWCHPGSSVSRRPRQRLAQIYLWLKRQKYRFEQCRKTAGSAGCDGPFPILLQGVILNHAVINTVQWATISRVWLCMPRPLKGNIPQTEIF